VDDNYMFFRAVRRPPSAQ